MSLHFPYIFLYFIFHYLRIYSRCGTSHLLLLQGYAHAVTFRSEPTTRRVFASACRDSFASAISTRLHPLDVGLSNTFLCVVGGVETRAAYDLIGKSWPGARYMRWAAQYSFPLLSAWPPLRSNLFRLLPQTVQASTAISPFPNLSSFFNYNRLWALGDKFTN